MTIRFVVAPVAAAALTAAAAGSVYSFNWDIENKTGLEAKDFHLTIVSDKALTHKTSFNGAFTAPTVDKKAGGLVYDISWAGGTVAKDGKTHVGLEFNGDKDAKLHVINVRWTGGDGRQIGKPDQQPAFTGWKVAAGFLPAFNAAPSDDIPDTDEDESAIFRNYTIGDARFALFDAPLPLESLQAGLLDSSPPESPIALSTGSEYSGPYATIDPLPASGYLVTQHTMTYAGAFGNITSVVYMQAEIPAPGAIALLALAAIPATRRRR